MEQVQIRGLVKLANDVRRAWTGTRNDGERTALIRQLQQILHQTDAMMRDCGTQPGRLPTPSRRAYEFLRQLAATNPAMTASPPPRAGLDTSAHVAAPPRFDAPDGLLSRDPRVPPAESVTFTGLRSFHRQLLDNIAWATSHGKLNREQMLNVIVSTRTRLDRHLEANAISAGQLTPASRELIAWFRWFSQPTAFEMYVDGVQRAQGVLANEAARPLNWRLPLLVRFEPTRRLYQWRVGATGTAICLATPWIAIGDEGFAALGRSMMRDPSANRIVTGLTVSEAYQELSQAIQNTIGLVQQTRGMIRDLAESFERVNRQYFQGSMPRPKLAWTRTLTGRVFGTYQHVSDTVSISSTLDHPNVPEFVLDHVMHHELLHKRLGVDWTKHRRGVHTPTFRAEERRFAHYVQAAAFLNQLARDAHR
jgi:hypothetical protein